MQSRSLLRGAAFVLSLAVAGACGGSSGDRAGSAAPSPSSSVPSSTTTDPAAADEVTDGVDEHLHGTDDAHGQAHVHVPPPPDWLGTRVLPKRPDGFGEIQPTPPELVDRRFQTKDVLPPPAGDAFESSTVPVPDDVLARSTWDPDCPVSSDELRYVTVSFWGFDGRPHTGELLLHRDVADHVVGAFARLHAGRYPIEEMRITTKAELDAPPTGDGNNTAAFVCRPVRGATRWSDHAYGKAVDINPFHNPYVKRDIVLPELASAYVDRANHRPGMLQPDTPEVRAFTDLGWGWGGAWSSVKDYMHVSESGK